MIKGRIGSDVISLKQVKLSLTSTLNFYAKNVETNKQQVTKTHNLPHHNFFVSKHSTHTKSQVMARSFSMLANGFITEFFW